VSKLQIARFSFCCNQGRSPLPPCGPQEDRIPSLVSFGHGQAIHGIPWTLQDNPGTASIKGHLNLPPPQAVSPDAAIEEWCVMGRKIACAVVLAAALIPTLCGLTYGGDAKPTQLPAYYYPFDLLGQKKAPDQRAGFKKMR